MKKCKGCKFFAEPNEYHQYNLCLFFCMDRIESDKCISEEKYFNHIWETYLELDKDYANLIEKINATDFKYNLFSYWNTDICKLVWEYGKDKEVCKQKIFEYKMKLLQEVTHYNNWIEIEDKNGN